MADATSVIQPDLDESRVNGFPVIQAGSQSDIHPTPPTTARSGSPPCTSLQNHASSPSILQDSRVCLAYAEVSRTSDCHSAITDAGTVMMRYILLLYTKLFTQILTLDSSYMWSGPGSMPRSGPGNVSTHEETRLWACVDIWGRGPKAPVACPAVPPDAAYSSRPPRERLVISVAAPVPTTRVHLILSHSYAAKLHTYYRFRVPSFLAVGSQDQHPPHSPHKVPGTVEMDTNTLNTASANETPHNSQRHLLQITA